MKVLTENKKGLLLVDSEGHATRDGEPATVDAEDVKEIRTSRGLSQGEFAEICCISGRQQVCNWETGYRNITRTTLALLYYRL